MGHLSCHVVGLVLGARNVLVMNLTWSLLLGSLQRGKKCTNNYNRSTVDGRLLIQVYQYMWKRWLLKWLQCFLLPDIHAHRQSPPLDWTH